MTDDDPNATLPKDEPAESPAEAVERLAGELDGVHRRTAGQTVEYVRGAVVFAVQEGKRLEFRLRAEIVAAGIRTPATSRSAHGPDWIVLDTGAGDTFTVDRTIAWFEMAWRVASELGPGAPKPH
jgi:hypothetical protein